jgi:hypothetical protein
MAGRTGRYDPADEQRLAELCARTEVTIRKDNKNPSFVDGIDVSGEIRTPEREC